MRLNFCTFSDASADSTCRMSSCRRLPKAGSWRVLCSPFASLSPGFVWSHVVSNPSLIGGALLVFLSNPGLWAQGFFGVQELNLLESLSNRERGNSLLASKPKLRTLHTPGSRFLVEFIAEPCGWMIQLDVDISRRLHQLMYAKPGQNLPETSERMANTRFTERTACMQGGRYGFAAT